MEKIEIKKLVEMRNLLKYYPKNWKVEEVLENIDFMDTVTREMQNEIGNLKTALEGAYEAIEELKLPK